jgi:hypothetical protein
MECVAFDPRSQRADVIYAIRGLENQGSWTGFVKLLTILPDLGHNYPGAEPSMVNPMSTAR